MHSLLLQRPGCSRFRFGRRSELTALRCARVSEEESYCPHAWRFGNLVFPELSPQPFHRVSLLHTIHWSWHSFDRPAHKLIPLRSWRVESRRMVSKLEPQFWFFTVRDGARIDNGRLRFLLLFLFLCLPRAFGAQSVQRS